MNATIASLDVVRAAIARCWLGDAPDEEPLGDVVLRPHQQRAVTRLRRALDRDGGALLADAVGLGKTFVALALARDARHAIVVAPAALRATWRAAATRCGVAIRLVSFEALSRAPHANDDPSGADLLIVDEAHHARNPATRRWRRLAALANGARVLLLTATPVHNDANDLRALLSLFLGERADRLDAAALLRLVVRRRHDDVRRASTDEGALPMPMVQRTRWRSLPPDRTIGRALRAISTPLATAGGETGGALWRMGLVRAWGSSDGALRAALRRRLAIAGALEAALDAGRLPTRHDLRAWIITDDAMQLALPLLVADTSAGSEAVAWRDVVRRHAAGVQAALDTLAMRPDRDVRRATWLRAIRRRHRGASIVAFTHSADTARALYRLLARDGGVALLTAAGGRVAGGPLGRAELLARFAPLAAGVPLPPVAERASLLVATDCLSEGLDLRDASVIVHVDVPWTPARLAQRVGRAVRLGSPHDAVHVYGLAPPAGVERWLRLGARLRAKAAAARRAVGDREHRRGAIRRGDAECAVRLAGRLERWSNDSLGGESHDASRVPVVAIVRAARAGFIAACIDERGPLLVAGDGQRTSDAPAMLLRVIGRVHRHARSRHRWESGRAPNDDAIRAILHATWQRIECWHRTVGAERRAGLSGADVVGARATQVMARVDAVVARAAPHRRPACAALAAAVRSTLARPLHAATEAGLSHSLAMPVDEAWLAEAARLVASYGVPDESIDRRLRLVAMIVFVPSCPA